MTTEELQAENKYLREKLQEERDYNQWVKEHRLKGYIAGYLSRCDGQFTAEHRDAETIEKTRTAVRKLAHNPALDVSVRGTLDNVGYYLDMYLYFREAYYRLLDTDKRLRQLDFRKRAMKYKKEKAGD